MVALTPAEYQTVFEPHLIWWPSLLGLLIAAGAGYFSYLAYLDGQPVGWLFSGAVALCAAIAAIGSGAVMAVQYVDFRRDLASGATLVAEGPVENFHPMPVGGHGVEAFTVQGVPFRYSDFVITEAFNHSAWYGGPIEPGLQVRIHYLPRPASQPAGENLILRLEVAR